MTSPDPLMIATLEEIAEAVNEMIDEAMAENMPSYIYMSLGQVLADIGSALDLMKNGIIKA